MTTDFQLQFTENTKSGLWRHRHRELVLSRVAKADSTDKWHIFFHGRGTMYTVRVCKKVCVVCPALACRLGIPGDMACARVRKISGAPPPCQLKVKMKVAAFLLLSGLACFCQAENLTLVLLVTAAQEVEDINVYHHWPKVRLRTVKLARAWMYSHPWPEQSALRTIKPSHVIRGAVITTYTCMNFLLVSLLWIYHTWELIVLVVLVCAVHYSAVLFLIEEMFAWFQGAVCLDGSPAGFYIREGSGSGSESWIVHLEGGGWCANETDCHDRSMTPLGSSKSWPSSISLGGFLSDDPQVNPDFTTGTLSMWSTVMELLLLGMCECRIQSTIPYMEIPIVSLLYIGSSLRKLLPTISL